MPHSEPVDILVVEDNDSQRASIVDALRESMPDIRVMAVDNGTTALDFLLCRAEWKDRADQDPPKLILLDLFLPGSDRISVLGTIRSLDKDEALTVAPVVIFSDSHAASDISKSYRCGANSYIIKPLSHPDFQAVVKSIGKYWMESTRTAV